MSNINWGLAVAELANAVGASFKHNEEEGFIEWTKGTAPTEAEIDAEVKRLQDEYDAQAYARNRKAEYDALNQLELISDDTINGTSTHKDAIEAIKAKYPKP